MKPIVLVHAVAAAAAGCILRQHDLIEHWLQATRSKLLTLWSLFHRDYHHIYWKPRSYIMQHFTSSIINRFQSSPALHYTQLKKSLNTLAAYANFSEARNTLEMKVLTQYEVAYSARNSKNAHFQNQSATHNRWGGLCPWCGVTGTREHHGTLTLPLTNLHTVICRCSAGLMKTSHLLTFG